tara:strand:- start:151819 stop:152301 length:483 start_codon:yes stop_codon:yes gene_type:complete
MLRRITGFIFLLILTSCEIFSPHSSTAVNQLKVVDTVIDFTKVDEYPLFTDCQSLTETTARKKCFETTLTSIISDLLLSHEYVVKKRVNDTAFVDLLVDNYGMATVVAIKSSEEVQQNLPKLDSLIRASVAQLPQMDPALKRGIPVRSQFKLSLIIKTID